MSLPIIVLGGGGHAKVLVDVLLGQNEDIVGFTALDQSLLGTSLLGIPYLGDDDAVLDYAANSVRLVNGLGSVGIPAARKQLYEQFTERGYSFASVIHPSAVISLNARLASGVQVLAGAVVQVDVCIGQNAIVNTKASVDHDCEVADHVHIAPGATLSGGVRIGRGTHVGVGATVIQGVTIGESCTIGAGALVLRDVPNHVTVFGVPGKEMSR